MQTLIPSKQVTTKTGERVSITWEGNTPAVQVADWPAPLRVRNLLADGDSNTKLRKTGKIMRSYGVSMLAAGHGGLANVCRLSDDGCNATPCDIRL